jgi:hypothetical protein
MLMRRCSGLLLALGLFVACTSGSGTDAGLDASGETGADSSAPQCVPPYGGPVNGPVDAHCKTDGGDIIQPVDMNSCHPPADASSPDAGTKPQPEILSGLEGDDVDCKYHVKWTANPGLCRNGGVTFTVIVTNKTDGKPATGAKPYGTFVLPPSRPAKGMPTNSVETSPGTYNIGPVIFDEKGKWLVEFHFYGECEETLDDSPHSHVSFFFNVP